MKTIQEMARECGFWLDGENQAMPMWVITPEELIAFAKLVREEALAQPQQEPVAWKLVPAKPTDEMLRAMDECSKEGYDERLYAGHAASVYMAAVDAAPTQPAQPEQEPVAYIDFQRGVLYRAEDAVCVAKSNTITSLYTSPPPQRTWVGLTHEEHMEIMTGTMTTSSRMAAVEAKLKEKNT